MKIFPFLFLKGELITEDVCHRCPILNLGTMLLFFDWHIQCISCVDVMHLWWHLWDSSPVNTVYCRTCVVLRYQCNHCINLWILIVNVIQHDVKFWTLGGHVYCWKMQTETRKPNKLEDDIMTCLLNKVTRKSFAILSASVLFLCQTKRPGTCSGFEPEQ